MAATKKNKKKSVVACKYKEVEELIATNTVETTMVWFGGKKIYSDFKVLYCLGSSELNKMIFLFFFSFFCPLLVPAVQLETIKAAKASKIFNETVGASIVKRHHFKPTRAHFPGSLWLGGVGRQFSLCTFRAKTVLTYLQTGRFSHEFLNAAVKSRTIISRRRMRGPKKIF